jgi:tyrosyl-tRNA synthetase
MNIGEQVAYLMQGTEYGDDALASAMEAELKDRLILAQKEGRPLKVYCGYDPTKPDLHIGHTVTMRKLRQFQELGHHVTFVVGTYTSLIGDPSDKDKLRPRLSPEEVNENARTYAEQAFRVLDREKTSIRFNAEWLADLTLEDMIKLASNFTIQQFMTRENFRKRWENNEAIHFHELFYAIMQGYDAHTLDTDVQVGGTDQLFNIVTASRKIMTYYGQKPNIGIILAILPGTDGKVKMSKSVGNHIPLNSTPEDMYGKVMSVPDHAMPIYAKLVTNWRPDEVGAFCDALESGRMHPRDAKMKLAREIVSVYYSPAEAERAQSNFVTLFQKGDIPDSISAYGIDGEESLLDIMLKAGLVESKGQGRRLIEQRGVRLDGNVVLDPMLIINDHGVLQVGKRQFLEIKLK